MERRMGFTGCGQWGGMQKGGVGLWRDRWAYRGNVGIVSTEQDADDEH